VTKPETITPFEPNVHRLVVGGPEQADGRRAGHKAREVEGGRGGEHVEPEVAGSVVRGGDHWESASFGSHEPGMKLATIADPPSSVQCGSTEPPGSGAPRPSTPVLKTTIGSAAAGNAAIATSATKSALRVALMVPSLGVAQVIERCECQASSRPRAVGWAG
jgi:hypothetical protein